MDTFISRSLNDTLALGESWGREAQVGWVIGLSGDLGAGKTQLVRGIAKGLGVADRVHSPTFALINEYLGGRLPMHHLDLYRLTSHNDILAAGLDEFFSPPGIAVIEWAERWEDTLPGSYRRVMIETLSENERKIIHEDFGD